MKTAFAKRSMKGCRTIMSFIKESINMIFIFGSNEAGIHGAGMATKNCWFDDQWKPFLEDYGYSFWGTF